MHADTRIICISGIDGCGKTSIIEGLQRALREEGRQTKYLWLRYNHYLTKILLAFCRLTGLTRYEYPDGIRVGYHDFHRSRIVSWAFIVLTYIDTWLVSLVLVYIPSWLHRDRIIICDRWVLDIMVDLEVDTRVRFSAGGKLERIFLWLLPGKSKSFLIQRDEGAVLGSRPENTKDGNFSRRCGLYRSFHGRDWVTVVHNDSSIDEAVRKIMLHCYVEARA